MITRLGLYGGSRGLYGDFSGKAAAAVQMSGSTGFAWTPSGALDLEATLAGSTGWDTNPTGSLDVEATLSGSTGFTWTPTGNLVDANAVIPSKKGGRTRRPKRYVVEVDGQFIEVSNVSEAESVLRQVRELATESAERDVQTPVTPKPPRIKIKTGTGKATTSKTLQKAVRTTQKTVNQAYIQAAKKIQKEREIDREIASLISDKLEEEDAIIALLL